MLVNLADLYYGRNIDIVTLNKERRGGIFSECCTESFKETFLWYFNEVLFEIVKKNLNNKDLGGTTPTAQ